MSLFISQGIRRLYLTLILILIIAAASSQVVAYNNAQWFKNSILQHDYRLAGALLEGRPELADEILAAFSSVNSEGNMEQGRQLLEQAGYKEMVPISLIPEANTIWGNSRVAFLFLFCLLIPGVLICVYLYSFRQEKKIDQYTRDIQRIMGGETGVRLDDGDEGSLPVLAASINQLIASLNTHIEKEKKSRRFLKDIIANISHQLKTPLSALCMYTEIMREEQVANEVVTDFLRKSENELERMQGLTTNLLKLAKLDAGIIELNKGKYSINEIVVDAVESLKTRMGKEEKNFTLTAESTINYDCDREWMLEAFSNLIKNAVEHTSAGDRIEVILEESPLMVRAIFRDNGEGIHPDDINHIFKRFYRSRFSQNKQGTGIGLTLSKTVIEMHDGYISVESTLKSGTEFTVTLPKLTNQ